MQVHNANDVGTKPNWQISNGTHLVHAAYGYPQTSDWAVSATTRISIMLMPLMNNGIVVFLWATTYGQIKKKYLPIIS